MCGPGRKGINVETGVLVRHRPVVAAGAVVGGVRLAADHTTVLDRFKGAREATAGPRSTTPPGPVPAPGQAFVTGTVDRMIADGAQGAPVVTPFTITALERGTGRATIENALVEGKRTSIAWAGGTPLPITGGEGSIDLGGSRVDVDAGGATWRVDGAPRALKPGGGCLALRENAWHCGRMPGIAGG